MAARFKNTRFGGANTPFGIPANFQIVSNNKESISSQVIPGCTLHSMWNAYLCTNDNIGQITFDSLDADRMDRSVQPVYIRESNSGFDNKLNSYMDHCWDGFYTCQKRETKFPTIIDTDWPEFEIEYTGTPPNAQEFRYLGKSDAPGKLISIKYPNAGAYQILDANRVPLSATPWDDVEKTWEKPTGKYCGEFRYEGVVNRLQFWMTPGCKLFIQPRDAIMLGIRLEFSMDDFFSKGGVTTFVDRMAAVLGIQKADLKVVSVYEGSTIVEFQVIDNPEAEAPIDLKAVKSIFDTVIKTVETFMDSPILSAVADGSPVLFGDGSQNQGTE